MTETYNYSGTGNSMSSMVDSNGITSSYTYTADGKNITSLTNGNSVVNYTYSGDNQTSVSQNVSGLTNSTGITNSYTYNSDNQVTSISHNDFSYNFTYDENSNNTAVSVGNQPLATYAYDTEGNITSMTYGNGFVISYTYDTDGNLSLIQYTSPDDNTTTDAFEFYYNDDGTPSTTADYCSDTTTEFYDEGYYVYKNETGEEIQSVIYDDDGNITDSGIFGTVYTEYLEDEFSFQTGETVYSENIFTDTSEMTRNAVYDYFGRKISSLTENMNWDTEDTITVEESIGYNDTTTTAGSRPTSYVSTVTSDNAEESLSFRYVYDNRGNITEIYDTSAVTEALYAKYAYDEAGQLIREDCAALNKTVTYLYDKGGNLVTKTEYPFTTGALGTASDTVSYTYDSVWKDKLVSYDGKAITYDAIGNPLSFDGQSFTWSGRELWKYESSDAEIDFRYNEYGLRTLKRIYEGTNVHNYYYFWSDDDRLLGYTVDLGESEEADTQVILIYDESNEPIGFTVAGFDFFYVKNIQGDVLKIVNPSGQTVVSFTYDAWGNFTLTPNSEADRTEITFAAAFNPIFYRGYLFDYETGLYYLQSRYYNPEMGRFINKDIYCDTGNSIISTNGFVYCENNPIIFVDFTGEICIFGFINNSNWFKTPWTTIKNCWQRKFGYCDLYDKAAFLVNIHIDCLISEFNYSNRKWRVELWKGRYGISLGAEIGFYYNENSRMFKSFYKCSDRDDIAMSLILYSSDSNHNLTEILSMDSGEEGHWWLTGFLYQGLSSAFKGKPKNLVLLARIEFFSDTMATLFCENLGKRVKSGYYKTIQDLDFVYVIWAPKEENTKNIEYEILDTESVA